MIKIRIFVYIVGALIMCMASSVITYFSLAGVGIIEAEKIALVYELSDKKSEYNGLDITLDETDISLMEGKLKEGHKASFEFVGSIKNVGREIISANIKIKDEKGFDVTNDYKISCNDASIIVTPRDIVISCDAEEGFYYNGNKLTYNKFEVLQGELIKGQYFEPEIKKEIINPGEKIEKDDVIPFIYDKSGIDVSGNYNITVNIGDTVIKQRPIVIKPKDVTYDYDGFEKTQSDIEIVAGSLIDGDFISSQVNGNAILAGKYTTTITNAIIKNAYDEDVTSNYLINKQTGIIEINPIELVIKTASESKIYDGTPLKNNQIQSKGLVNGDILNTLNMVNESQITDYGVKENVCTEVLVTTADGIDVTNCYKITYEYGTLQIEKRNLKLTASSDSKIYDGTPLTFGNEIKHQDDLQGITGLLENHTIEFKYSGSITNYGQANNTIIDVIIKDAFNNDITKNYKFDIIDGTLKIDKRQLTLYGISKSEVYDEEVKNLNTKNDMYVESAYGLVRDIVKEDIVVSYINELTYIGSIPNVFIVNDIKGDDPNNYNITFVNGTLSYLEKQQIELTAISIEKVYDGIGINPDTISNMYQEDVELLPGHRIKSVTYEDFFEIYCGKQITTIKEFLIVDEKDNNVMRFYEYKLNDGLIEIKKKELILTTYTISKTYDGSNINVPDEFEEVNELAEYDYIEIYRKPERFNNVQKVENILEFDIMRFGISVKEYYEITENNGYLEILPRDLEIIATDYEKTYDGEILYNDDLVINYTKLLENHTLNFEYNYEDLQDAGTYNGYIKSYSIISDSGEDVTGYYNLINYVNGNIIINKVKATLIADSNEKIYDGTALIGDPEKTKSYGLLPIYTINVKLNGSIITFGETENIIESYSIESYGLDITNNFDITLVSGTLKILKRDILIETNSKTKSYDGVELKDAGIKEVDIAKTDELSFDLPAKIKNVGSVVNKIENIYIKNLETGKVVNDSYEISIKEGVLTINKETINLQYSRLLSVLYGTEITFAPNYIRVSDHNELSVIIDSFSVNYDALMVQIDKVTILKDNENVTENYSFTATNRITLYFEKRDLFIEINKSNLVIGNNYSIYELINISSFTPLAQGDYLSISNQTFTYQENTTIDDITSFVMQNITLNSKVNDTLNNLYNVKYIIK